MSLSTSPCSFFPPQLFHPQVCCGFFSWYCVFENMSAPRGDPFQFMDRHKAGGAGGAGGGGGGGSTSSPMSIPARGAASSSGADFASLSVSLPPVSEGGRRR